MTLMQTIMHTKNTGPMPSKHGNLYNFYTYPGTGAMLISGLLVFGLFGLGG